MSNNSSNLPRLRRIGSNASISTAADSRPTRSSNQNECNSSEPSRTTTTILTRSRFGFASTSGAPPNHQTNLPNRNPAIDDPSGCHTQPHPPKSCRNPAISPSESARPMSALGRPATALGTRSVAIPQPSTRLPQSTNIPPSTRKRRTSSLSSQRPSRPSPNPNGFDSKYSNPSNLEASLPSLQKQLAEALEQFNRAQEECNQWKTRLIEAESRLVKSDKDQHDQRISFAEEIQKLGQEHSQSIRDIKQDLNAQLSHSQSLIDSLQASNLALQQQLDQKTATTDCLQTEIEQMDIDSGRSAAQVIELTRLKADLEVKLEAVQSQLDRTVSENEKRIDQITQHYHNIQSKLHHELEQISTEYQASLQQQSSSPKPEVVTKLRSRISQLEKQVLVQESEFNKCKTQVEKLTSLTVRHEEEKHGWDLLREQLEKELQELKSRDSLALDVHTSQPQTCPFKAQEYLPNEEHSLIDFVTSIGGFQSDVSLLRIKERLSTGADTVQSHLHTDSLIIDSVGGQALSDSGTPLESPNLSSPDAVPRKLYDHALRDLENLKGQLTDLNTELMSAHESIGDLEGCRSQAEQAHLALQQELESLKNDLPIRLASSQQMIDDLKANTVSREIHENTLLAMNNLQTDVADLRAELSSAQLTISHLNMSREALATSELTLSDLKKDSAQEIVRLSQAHAQETGQSARRITQLQTELNQANALYAQAVSKLEDLQAFNPPQVVVLTSRLREERDASRRAVEFLNVERRFIEDAARDDISKLQTAHQKILDEATTERNTLVVAILTLQQAFKCFRQASTLAKVHESNMIEGSPKVDSIPMDLSLQSNHDSIADYSLASHLRADLGLGFDQSIEQSKLDDSLHTFAKPKDLANCSISSYQRGDSGTGDLESVKDASAYKTALQQVISLTAQVDDLKEQLLRAHVAHHDEEKMALQDLENLRHQIFFVQEQHGRVDAEKTKLISSLELNLAGIQHQFQTLESSYNDLRDKNTELNAMLTSQRAISSEVEQTNQSIRSDRDSLRSQIESMDEEIQKYRQQAVDLQEQLGSARDASKAASEQFDLANELMKAETETLRSELEAVKREIQAYERQVQQLSGEQKVRTDGDTLRSQIESMVEEIEKYRQQAVELQEQLCSAQDASKAASEQFDLANELVKAETETLRSELEAVKHEIQAYERQVADLQEQLAEEQKLRIDGVGLHSRIESMDEDIENYRQQAADLQEQLGSAQDASKAASEQFDLANELMKAETETLRSELETVKRGIQAYERQVADFQEQLAAEQQSSAMASEQFAHDSQTMQTEAGQLRSQIDSMDEDIQTYQEQIADLQEQLSVAKEAQDVVSDKQAQDLLSQVEQLTRDLSAQKNLVEAVEERLKDIYLLHDEKTKVIESLEISSTAQEFNSQAELERKDTELMTQKREFEERLTESLNTIKSESLRIIELEKEVHELTFNLQDENQQHRKVQHELEEKLSEATNDLAAIAERNGLLEARIEELHVEVKTLDTANEALNQKFQATSEELVMKGKISEELGQTKEELAAVIRSRDLMGEELDEMRRNVRLLTEELDEVKSHHSIDDGPKERYEALLSDFRDLEQQLSSSTTELESLRSQHMASTTMLESLKVESQDKDLMINSLKADLATVSKLHRGSSVDTTDRIKELEERVKSKTVEAEDALDRLLDEMQKNKRLTNLVETMKMKLKSRSKSVSSSHGKCEPDSGDGEHGATAGSGLHEPVDPSGSSNSRKRKLEASGSVILPRFQTGTDDTDQNKENSGVSEGRQSGRRKMNLSEPVQTTQEEVIGAHPNSHQVRDDNRQSNLGILLPVQVNKQRPIVPQELRQTEKSDAKPVSTASTNSNLLASIQSLRRKQQNKQHTSSTVIPNTVNNPAEPRRSSLRLIRKDAEFS